MPVDLPTKPVLTPQQGQWLVALARRTMATQLKGQHSDQTQADLESRFQDRIFQIPCGVFVTLKIKGALRGCIGHLTGRESLTQGVRTNAVNAAFHDPRFSPLTEAELNRSTIEVSVLTPPQTLQYNDAEDLLAKLQPGVDGVTIRRKSASATFLPQVWEQLPEKKSFLGQLCRKAGLEDDAWRHADLEVETYQVQSFSESSSESS